MKRIFLFILFITYIFDLVAQTPSKNPFDTLSPDVVVFVNGYWGKQKISPAKFPLQSYWQYDSIQTIAREKWNYNQIQAELFFEECFRFFGTRKAIFIDGGNFPPYCSAKRRQRKGAKYIDNQLDTILKLNNIDSVRTFHFVTHSMGGAYAEGMINALQMRKNRVGVVLHVAPSEAGSIKVNRTDFGPQKRIQIISEGDNTVKLVNRWHRYEKDNLTIRIKDCDLFACFYESDVTRPQAGDIGHALHMRKIVFDIVKDMERIKFDGDGQYIILKESSNLIPYRRICKGAFCVTYSADKGYFVPK